MREACGKAAGAHCESNRYPVGETSPLRRLIRAASLRIFIDFKLRMKTLYHILLFLSISKFVPIKKFTTENCRKRNFSVFSCVSPPFGYIFVNARKKESDRGKICRRFAFRFKRAKKHPIQTVI